VDPAVTSRPTLQGAVLLGPDHPRLDEIAVAAVGRRAAVGLSRGRFAKGYPHVDPNEDAVATFTDGDRWLMAVADGHGGAAAATAAVRAIASKASSLMAESPAEATRAAMALAAGAVRDAADTEPSSRTALTVAAIAGDTVHHASAGDSAVYVVARRGVRRVEVAAPFLSGSAVGVPPVLSVTLRHRSTVVLATDGLGDFLGRHWQRIIRVACRADPASTARALILAACERGAGDNVAVAVRG
jgi:serine/threonine protein phosphatase PrpC